MGALLPLLDEQPAPEPSGALSAYALLPDDLLGRGHKGSPDALFGRLQRPDTYVGDAPSVGKRSRAALEGLDLSLPRVIDTAPSEDGSVRCVLQTADGHRIEAVWMPRATKNPRVTMCISSQVGCAMGCTFCATGTMGIRRNLTAGEIVGQVLALMLRFGPATGHHVNIVFMGMGEPLHNIAHLEQALRVLSHPMGLGIAPSRITVSTSGLVPGIDRLAKLPERPLLALSVNATTDDARKRTMPVARKWSLDDLRAALLRWPLAKREKVTLEYVLLCGENDTYADAERLASFASGFRHLVNVIPLNAHEHTDHRRPAQEHVRQFADWLTALGCRTIVRNSRGQDIGGACGQLVQGATNARPPVPPVRS